MTQNQGFEPNVNIVIAWRFYSESQARLYQSKLRLSGISSFLSNHYTSNLIPFGNGGILLHVKEDDLDESLRIIQETYKDSLKAAEHDFTEADLADIEYEKELKKKELKLSRAKEVPFSFWICLIIMGLMISLMFSYLINFN